MTIRTSPWPTGVPCWADLGTTDVPGAKSFYAAVLGWTFDELGEEFAGYVLAGASGHRAAGLGPLQEPDQPSAWTMYFASDDATNTLEAVVQNGGSVVLPVSDAGPMGRMAIAVDPTGAAFGIWQAVTHIGAEIVNEPGGITWEDLRSTDPDAARAFYDAVFGFRHDPMPGAPGDYMLFALPSGDGPLGGMGGMFHADDSTPSHWMVYFAVPDADEAVKVAVDHGGSVIAPVFDTPFGRMGGVADPAGAQFFVAGIPPMQ